MKKLFFFLTGLAFLITSCKEDKKEEIDPYILLTSKSWKPALFDKNTTTNPPGENFYSAILNCERDDDYVFSTSNKLTINKGQDKCDIGESIIDISDFILDVSGKRIIIKGEPYILAELSTTQLKYYAPIPRATNYDNLIYIFEH